MTYSNSTIWLIILALGVGTYLIRLSFLGLVGDRKMPDWVMRHLRYTPVAVLPGLVAPLVLWPEATGGEPDPVRLAAATVPRMRFGESALAPSPLPGLPRCSSPEEARYRP